jgi:arylsulfatase A-like enzyme
MIGYSAPLVANEAIRWLKEVRDPDKPFVLSVWFHEPHKPIATDIKFSSLYPDQNERNSTYYGNITQMDYALGKVMKALDAVGVSENTLLIFTSDNGPVASEGGSTGGLRGGKRSDFEGGICVPFLVRWPSHVPAGTVSDVPVIGTDIFSTVLDITGIPQPTDRTIDGVSIFPVFNGQRVERKTPLFWRTHVSGADNRVAVRVDDWKIVANDTLTDFMLFNVQEDRVEKDDLTSKMPGKTEEMKKLLLATWADIVEEGPNEWWETERQKPSKGGTLSF